MLIQHHAHWPDASLQGPGRLRLVLRTERGRVQAAGVLWEERYTWPRSLAEARPDAEGTGARCAWAGQDGYWDYWEAEIRLSTGRYRYLFWVRPQAPPSPGHPEADGDTEGRPGMGSGAGQSNPLWFGYDGLAAEAGLAQPFEVPHPLSTEAPEVPDWARGAVFYQIFVDRFCNGDPSNDPPGTLSWGEQSHKSPVPRGSKVFYGGDLAGVVERLPYLADLAVEAIYLTPIFRSPSNHKYDTEDYLAVDPAFGDTELLRELVRQAHALGIRVLLDLVFNHSGDRFFAFQEVLCREDSPYRRWYFFEPGPVRTHPPSYETFATGVATMPKLNTRDPEVRTYLVNVALHWLRAAGVDGFRFDVADEIDRTLLRELREKVRALRPDALLIGEIWYPAPSWLRGDQFDSVMNYPWRAAVLDFFAHGSVGPTEFWRRLERLRFSYAPPVTEGLVNLLGSHDTPRFLTLAGGELWRLRLATLFQFGYPGIAQVYYGDEAAMEGGQDPDCRRPMDWRQEGAAGSMRQLVRQLARLRRSIPSLRTGGVQLVAADDGARALAFLRTGGQEQGRPREDQQAEGGFPCLVAINAGERPWEFEAPLPSSAMPPALSQAPASAGQAPQGGGWKLVLVAGDCGPGTVWVGGGQGVWPEKGDPATAGDQEPAAEGAARVDGDRVRLGPRTGCILLWEHRLP